MAPGPMQQQICRAAKELLEAQQDLETALAPQLRTPTPEIQSALAELKNVKAGWGKRKKIRELGRKLAVVYFDDPRPFLKLLSTKAVPVESLKTLLDRLADADTKNPGVTVSQLLSGQQGNSRQLDSSGPRRSQSPTGPRRNQSPPPPRAFDIDWLEGDKKLDLDWLEESLKDDRSPDRWVGQEPQQGESSPELPRGSARQSPQELARGSSKSKEKVKAKVPQRSGQAQRRQGRARTAPLDTAKRNSSVVEVGPGTTLEAPTISVNRAPVKRLSASGMQSGRDTQESYEGQDQQEFPKRPSSRSMVTVDASSKRSSFRRVSSDIRPSATSDVVTDTPDDLKARDRESLFFEGAASAKSPLSPYLPPEPSGATGKNMSQRSDTQGQDSAKSANQFAKARTPSPNNRGTERGSASRALSPHLRASPTSGNLTLKLDASSGALSTSLDSPSPSRAPIVFQTSRRTVRARSLPASRPRKKSPQKASRGGAKSPGLGVFVSLSGSGSETYKEYKSSRKKAIQDLYQAKAARPNRFDKYLPMSTNKSSYDATLGVEHRPNPAEKRAVHREMQQLNDQWWDERLAAGHSERRERAIDKWEEKLRLTREDAENKRKEHQRVRALVGKYTQVAPQVIQVVARVNYAISKRARFVKGCRIRDIRGLFRAMDTDNDSFLGHEELQDGILRLNINMPPNAMEVFMAEVGYSFAEDIEYKPFVKWWEQAEVLHDAEQARYDKRFNESNEYLKARKIRSAASNVVSQLEFILKGYEVTVSENGKKVKRPRKLYGKDITNAESFFQALDFDGSGDIHPAEIGAGLKRLDIVAADGDIQALVDMVDTNNDGNISLLEVLSWVSYGCVGVATAMQIREVFDQNRLLYGYPVTDPASLFEAIDYEGNGIIGFEDLNQGLKMLQVWVGSPELDELISSLDKDRSSSIDKEDLIWVLDHRSQQEYIHAKMNKSQ